MYPDRAADRQPDRRGIQVQQIIADLRVRIESLITTIRKIVKTVAAVQLAVGTVQIMNALREAMAGRTIDSARITIPETLRLKHPERMRRSIEKMKSAGAIRTGINALRKI
jgi:hypothetical protein